MMSPCRDVLVRSGAHSQRGPVTDSLRHPVLARLASRQCILPLGPIPSFLEDLVASAQSGTLYRGREGMWSWVAHRISGMLIFLFLLVHVLDTALVRVSPEAYNEVIGHYKSVVFGLGEIGLVAAVLFHALNGLRIILVDFWKGGTKFHKQMLWGVLILWVVTVAAFSIRHLSLAFGGH